MEPETFTTWDCWEARCVQLGYDGPHKIMGQSTWQFVGKNGATAAMWNAANARGFVFRPEPEAQK